MLVIRVKVLHLFDMQSVVNVPATVLSDKLLPCQACGVSFAFSSSEQEFFALKGLQNEPKRCMSCRLKDRAIRGGKENFRLTEVPCADCGALTNVPFQPKGYRPVFCYACYHEKKKRKREKH